MATHVEPNDVEEAAALLGGSAMFHRCKTEALKGLARQMEKRTFTRGEDIAVQGQNTDRFWLLASGYARRLRKESDGIQHHVDTKACGNTISALQVVSGDPVYATARCVTRSCTAYSMSREAFIKHLSANPALSADIVASLSERLRKKVLHRTPLLQQRSHEVNYIAVTIAASVESYYRSALNSLLNRRLSGVSSPLFPNMHVQIPTRIMYMNGFKGLRALFDREFDPDKLPNHPARVAGRFAVTIAPGLAMTPISSILEASNAGHANKEPLLRRSLRGTVPRAGREVIFGIGLNQLSDYCEERYRSIISNQILANSAGSLTAGVVAGYFSHVPHNISTFKLLNPQKSYREIFKMFIDKSAPEHIIPKGAPPSLVEPMRTVVAFVFPRGVLVRTAQICGSFVILNGVIQLIERDQRKRLESAFQVSSDDSGEPSAEPTESLLETEDA